MAGAVDPSDVSYEGLGVAPNMEVIRGCMDVTAAPPISQLRQETNRGITSPISVLPSDVLLLIFEACIRGAPLSDLSHPGLALVGSNHQAQSLNDPPIPLRVSTSPLLGWIVCSHVCRRWRSLALTTPSLWTVVFLDLGPTWLNQSLSRSRSAPGVRFFGHLTAAYDTFLKHSSGRVVDFSRASQISVVASRDNLFSFLDGFRFVAPALKNVELTGSSDVFGPRGDTQHAPLGLLMRNSPYLKHISLHSILVVWTPLQTHARHLTHLEISFHTYFFMSTSPIARIEDAVGFLQSAPALEVLILIEGFVECSMEHAKSRGPRAELPHLRKFVLDDDSSVCLYLLNHVGFPPTSQVRIRFRNTWINEDDAASVTRRIFQHFQEKTQHDKATGALALLYNDHTGLQLQASSTVPPNFLPHRSDDRLPEMDVCLWFNHLFTPQEKWSLFRAACSALPSNLVHTLVLEGGDDQELWAALASRFPRTMHITCVITRAATDLCKRLLSAEEDQLAFPERRRLTISYRIDPFVAADRKEIKGSLLELVKGCMARAPRRRLVMSFKVTKEWVDVRGEAILEHGEAR